MSTSPSLLVQPFPISANAACNTPRLPYDSCHTCRWDFNSLYARSLSNYSCRTFVFCASFVYYTDVPDIDVDDKPTAVRNETVIKQSRCVRYSPDVTDTSPVITHVPEPAMILTTTPTEPVFFKGNSGFFSKTTINTSLQDMPQISATNCDPDHAQKFAAVPSHNYAIWPEKLARDPIVRLSYGSSETDSSKRQQRSADHLESNTTKWI